MAKRNFSRRDAIRAVTASAAALAVTLNDDDAFGAPKPHVLPALKAERLAEITGAISAAPVFFTPPFTDRAFWKRVAGERNGAALIAEAQRLAKEPVPELSQALYLEKQRVGRRIGFDANYNDRTIRLGAFLYAAGFSGDEVWVPLITREIEAILEEPAWSAPRIATTEKTWEAARYIVDLGSASRAWNLALADYLLGGRIAPEPRARIRQNVRERVLDPYIQRVRAGDSEAAGRNFDWMAGGNNWNAVCNAAVLGAALLVSRDVRERAEFLAAYEAYTPFFVRGYGDDGFCFEGLGYWSYGFRNYVVGAELVRLATGGKIDLLAGSDKVRRMAQFGQRYNIVNGISPSFGDESFPEIVNPDAPSILSDFAALRFGGSGRLRPVTKGPSVILHHPLGAQLYATAFDFSLPRPAAGSKEALALAGRENAEASLRDWFPNGGTLLVRRHPAGRGLAAAFRGGNNGVPHNHNDLGSFVVVRDGHIVLSDLGRDEYMNDTFSSKRYTSQVMNSFGHPVPLVAGKLQKTGKAARAKIVSTEFTDPRDTWTIDIASAYDVPDLEQLTRTFVFDRAGDGRIEVIDHVRFRAPQAFGMALVTPPNHGFVREKDGRLRFAAIDGRSPGVVVSFETADGPLKIAEAPIHGIVADAPPRGTRIGIDFAQPVLQATLKTVILPDNL